MFIHYKRTILPVALHGYETWSFITKAKHKFKVYKNKFLLNFFIYLYIAFLQSTQDT
jgi:hypothetical protein